MKRSITQTTVAVQAHKVLHPLQADMKRLLQNLVRTNSVAVPPNGNETPAQLILLDFSQAHGIRPELYGTAFLATSKNPLVQKGRNYKGRKNLSVRLPGQAVARAFSSMDIWTPSLPAGRAGRHRPGLLFRAMDVSMGSAVSI